MSPHLYRVGESYSPTRARWAETTEYNYRAGGADPRRRLVGPEEILAARRRLGLSQAALAKKLSIPANTLARWERGELTIQHPELLRLALVAIEAEQVQG